MEENLPAAPSAPSEPTAPAPVAGPIPEAPSAAPQPVSVETPPASKSSKTLLLGGIAAFVVVIAVGAYVAMAYIITPAQVKEKAQASQPVFTDLTKSMKKIEDHLLEDNNSANTGSDDMENEAEKGKTLLVSAKKNRDLLNKELSSMSNSALSRYKTSLSSYVTQANKLIADEEDEVAFAQGYIQPMKDYEKFSKDVSGAGSYMFSDPQRYIATLTDAISREEQIIAQFQTVKAQGKLTEVHNAYLQLLQTELTFLKELKDAVSTKNTAGITAATKKYTEATQDNAKTLGKVVEKGKDAMKDEKSDLSSNEGKVNTEYSSLKDSYKF